MDAIRYLADILSWLLLLAFVLRLLFQLVRADFRDPLADAVVRVTNWLVLPLRRVLPPVRKIDTATVVAVLLIALGRTALTLLLAGYGSLAWLAGLRLSVIDLVTLLLKIYLFGLLAYWIIGLIAPGGYSPGLRLLSQLCEPVLKPVRRLIPPIGRIDFSPLWLSILISALLLLVR
ncbi:MAG: YggT family protein [Proteobacteria bacterium]|nr:YggT family protein [Pseudomonadota bacterium]